MRRNQSSLYGIHIFDQYMSRGSGAKSMAHNMGFEDWGICEATTAA